jgi:ABC transport system ATP-binding/permease protein
VGRSPQSNIVITDSRVSWDHAILRTENAGWFVEDCGSTNGTFVDGQKIGRFEITRDCTLRFGDAADAPTVFCSPSRPSILAGALNGAPGPPRSKASDGDSSHRSLVDLRPIAIVSAPARTLRIGRADDNDIVVADLSVSRHHAELRNVAGRYQIVDLDSHNGTFLNGSRIADRAPVTELDIIGIGPATFRLVGDERREFIDEGDVSLIAQDVTVRVGEQVLIDRVSFPVSEGSLVAIIGPSGSGKTMLLNALTGLRPGRTPVVKVTGSSNRRVSLAALIAVRPGQRPRLIYRVHKGRRHRTDQRKGFTEADASPRCSGHPHLTAYSAPTQAGMRPTRLGRCHRDDKASGDGVPKRVMPWAGGRDQRMASRS